MRVRSYSWFAAPFFGFLLLCASCSKEPELQLPEDTLAVIGARVITLRDLDSEAARRLDEGLPVLRPLDLFDRMLTQEALLVKARSLELEKDPEVKREIERILISRLRDRELTARGESLAVSEEDLKKAYNDGIGRFSTPALNRMAMLYLKKDKNASSAKLDELRARMNEAKTAADQLAPGTAGFGALSVSYSEDVVSRYRGGDLGWIRGVEAPAQLPENVFLHALELPIGTLSDVMETESGFYLVMRTDERAASVKPFEQVRVGLEKQWLAEQRAAAEQAYYRDCLMLADVKRDEENIARLTAGNAKSDSGAVVLPDLQAGFKNE